MKYISTRGDTDPKPFSEVLLMGLAPDGGLMLPEHYPQVSVQTRLGAARLPRFGF